MIYATTAEAALQRCRQVKSLGTGVGHWNTDFLERRGFELRDEPQAFFIEIPANETVALHFHAVDRFPIVVAGSGMPGRVGADKMAHASGASAVGGHHCLVLNGHLTSGGKEYPVWSALFTDSTEATPEISAGATAVELLVLPFPRAAA